MGLANRRHDPDQSERTSEHRHRLGRRWSRRKVLGAALVGASIIAFVTTPLGTAVVYVSTQLAVDAPAAALPPPATGFSHGAAGSALNGFGGSVAPSATTQSWPATGAGGNGGPFAFVGAHHGALWGLPAGDNNSRGVGYCTMEDVAGSGAVALKPDPPRWDAGEMARAAALMSTFGGDRVVPYGVDDGGNYDVITGEWEHPLLWGGGEYTRRRQVAVNFGVRMFLDDVSPDGAAAGRKLARDTSIVDGSGGEFAALRAGYTVAQYMAEVGDAQSAIGGITLTMAWGTPTGLAPTTPGTYPVEVIVTDSTGRRVGLVPVLQLSDVGIGPNRSVAATATVDNSLDSSDDMARWNAAAAAGWPVWNMVGLLATDARFAVGRGGAGASAADVTDRSGVARFDVTITSPSWELAFHAQAPTDDVSLYSGTGVQGQVTWSGMPQSASVHAASAPPELGRFQIRKVLDDAGVQGARDMSGFTFTVSAVGSFVTDAAGLTAVIEATPGEYVVTEVGRPAWAESLIDGGPITFRLAGGPDPGVLPVVEFVYTNRVPAASITTAASDPTDGDRFVTIDADGARAVDDVGYCGLVPGTAYRLLGTIHVLADTAASPSGVEGSTTFTPTAPCGTAQVAFGIPAGSTLLGRIGVVFQTLTVASTGQVVAAHNDPASAAQTLYFPTVATVMRPALAGLGDGRDTIEVGDGVVDVVSVAGLAPGLDYRADLVLHERLDDGTCVATGMTASHEFSTPALGDGSVSVGPVTIDEPGVFVGFQRIHVIEPSNSDVPMASLVASHEDCDATSQTVRVIPPPPPTTPPPTSTPPPTTPPTSTPMTTTPSVASVPTPPAETTSTTTPPTTGVLPGRPLPRTGSSTHALVTTAALLATCGIGAVAFSRRRW